MIIDAEFQEINKTLDADFGVVTSIAESERNQAYEQGLREMWEAIQVGGKRTNYNQALIDYIAWTKKNFKPIYDITFTSAYFLTRNRTTDIDDLRLQEGNINLVEYTAETGVNFTFACGGTWGYAFAGTIFSVFDTLDLTNATSLDGLFYGGFTSGTRYAVLQPKRVEHLICSEANEFKNNSFQYQSNFEHIGFEGVIAKNGLNLSWSENLDKESLLALIDCLKDFAVTEGSYYNDIYMPSVVLDNVPIVPSSVTFTYTGSSYAGEYTDNGNGQFVYNDILLATIDYETGDLICVEGGGVEPSTTITYSYRTTTPSETRTVTLGATNLAKLTADEIAVATNKGWVLN